MKKFICTICGYIYDEEKGIAEKGIKPGTTWSSLPDNWQCPLCGAPKAMFKEIVEETPVEKQNIEPISIEKEELREITYKELGAICSNLSKGCTKQYLSEQSTLFNELAVYFDKLDQKNIESSYENLIDKINNDLEKTYPIIKKLCLDNQDRGALRTVTWGEKTTLILKSLIEKYHNEGSKFLENTNIYVCDICGFIYIGNDVLSVCPVCKVPSLKILQIKGGK